MATNGMSKMSDQVSVDQVKREGCLLWAKIRGYSYWPGIVTVDPMDGLTISESSKTPKVHVHFLGYSNMRGWVELSNILQYEGKASYDQMAAKCSKSRHKDFFPTKKYQRLFDKAAQKAEEVMQIPQEKRLKSLGLIYVLVDNDDNTSGASSSNGSTATPLPKITTGVGFFKSYQPPPEPTKPLEKTLDIFDFDDFEDIPSSPFAGSGIGNVGSASSEKKSEEEAEVVVKSSKPTPKLELQKTRKEKTTKRKSSTPLVPASKALSSSKLAKKSSSAKANTAAKSVPKKVKVSSLENDQASLMIEDLKENDEFNDNPSLGSLVWGRMSGFPYWPCFVTRSPVSGEMSRTYGKREESHAQFFNWNNESGWIQSLLPWCSMNEYHSRAKMACPKGANSAEFRNWYPPARLLARWKGAIAQAQKTENMSRKERHSSLVVNYPAARGKASKKTTKANTPKKAVVEAEEDDAKPITTAATEDDKAVDKACPASKKNIVFKNGLSLGKVELPKGWTYEFFCRENSNYTLKFTNPEGMSYNGVEEAIAHLMQQNCAPPPTTSYSRCHRRKRSYSTSSLDGSPVESTLFGWFLKNTDKMRFDTKAQGCTSQAGNLEGAVEYLKDTSLPSAWSVRTIRSKSLDDGMLEVLYQSNEHRFNDKVSVAEFLEGMGHPALEVEQLLLNLPSIAHAVPRRASDTYKDDEDDDNSKTYTTILLSQCSVEEVGKNPQLAKTVVPCFIDMVKLPDIFLQHPSVRVEESQQDQVMTIRDSITNSFIAKKIIYD